MSTINLGGDSLAMRSTSQAMWRMETGVKVNLGGFGGVGYLAFQKAGYAYGGLSAATSGADSALAFKQAVGADICLTSPTSGTRSGSIAVRAPVYIFTNDIALIAFGNYGTANSYIGF